MREPAFWHSPPSALSRLLAPLAALYGGIASRRMVRTGADAGIPVLCVGNYHVGGAGKTPTVLALVELLRASGEVPVVLSRGYGGRLPGPLRVDPFHHQAADVGDEPLMMAARVDVVISRDRNAGAALARSHGASVIVMDDGFQNPAVAKDASLIVIDAHRGLGNGCVLPAGPLRAPLALQVARTDAMIVIGQGDAATAVAAAVRARGAPVLPAHLAPSEASIGALHGKRVLAFAGIGDPHRFFRTLKSAGVDVGAQRIFPDHHPYSTGEIAELLAQADRDGLTLVTTEKDLVRLRAFPAAADIVPFAVALAFADTAAIRSFLQDRLQRARARRA